jgi:A/G-specific adenine glycosylase
VFDLGALVCTRRQPACERCPVRRWCAWQRAGCPAPDPIAGSAGISTGQPRFEGSDRQARGRLVAALCNGPVAKPDLPAVMGLADDPTRAARVAAQLAAEGFAVEEPTFLRLP